MPPEKISRQELHNLVWTEPGTHVARRLEISDVAVAKICRKLEVPRPPRGYWAKLQHGHEVRRVDLPYPSDGTPETYYFRGADRPLAKRAATGPEICVPDTLKGCHEAVRQMKNIWTKARKDGYGKRICRGLQVTPGTSNRALRILDGITKHLASKGFELSANEHGIGIPIEDEELTISIEERLTKSDHVPSARELREKERYEWIRIPKYDYRPSGKLRIRCEHYFLGRCRTTFGDRKNAELEELLGQFALTIESAIEIVREKCLERAREDYLEMLERRRTRRIEAAIRGTHARAGTVDKLVADLEKARQTRDWIDVMDGECGLSPDKIRLVRWAKQYADHIDPTHPSRISYLDLDPPEERPSWW